MQKPCLSQVTSPNPNPLPVTGFLPAPLYPECVRVNSRLPWSARRGFDTRGHHTTPFPPPLGRSASLLLPHSLLLDIPPPSLSPKPSASRPPSHCLQGPGRRHLAALCWPALAAAHSYSSPHAVSSALRTTLTSLH